MSIRGAPLAHDLENHSHWVRKCQETEMDELVRTRSCLLRRASTRQAPALAPATASAIEELSAQTLSGSKHNIKKQVAREATGLRKKFKKLALQAQQTDVVNEI